ncbi:aliphatic sulfonate ABC transporter substrate-binding protein [Lacticaseibacillus manihotivorans]|uniref:Putative aliphatic sulfonates-binding protein n=2 Tax=Lacticaseibacillus manihotivorans TaxID=88233 RepID=A0A0R1RA79_9LACO|nr:aliphatic sulfonate ABC transporter substrate-binding protein [Lacticaseibacillus manihotivorans]KRL53593.1 nitrate sulfonate bicarbonate ABC transporter substrate-binding protein [Lacticaseibacillus manihotivorans DSM 13343 = JCM 12514]QFQ90403.1 aliphatic sulfonate ABC transporter substrate-binding protein [Lacticaseibacillus manihotivorans]
MKKKSLLTILLVVIVAAVAWFGWSSTHQASSTKLTTVTIGYQKADPVDISRARGELAKKMKAKGYKVVFKEFQDGTALTTALKSGDIDYARVGDVPPVTAQANGLDFVYVAAGSDKVQGSGIEVKKTSGITSLADLKGKTIAYTKGTSSQYMLIQALKKAGLSTSDVKMVSMDQATAAVAFAKGTVDAWASWDPYTATAEVNNDATLLVDDTGLAKNRDFLISTETYASKNKDVSKLLTKYLGQDMTWANNHKTQLTTMLMKMLKLKKAIVKKMVDRRTYSFGSVSDSILKEQQSIADVFYQQKIVTKKVDVTKATVK